MKNIECRNKDGEIIGLVLRPETGEYLGRSDLEKLSRYVQHVTQLSELTVNEKGYSLPELSQEELEKVLSTCQKQLSEKVIVPQIMKFPPAIRHRPLYFELEGNNLIVKYTELGEFNSFDSALLDLSREYGSL